MLDSPPVSFEELEQLLKSLNERLKYLEKIVIPSRVTKEELHSHVSDAKVFTMTNVAQLRTDVRIMKDQMATRGDLERLREELLKELAGAKNRYPARRRTGSSKPAAE